MYYRGAHAAVLVFDVTSADTLDKVGEWADELHGHASDDILLVLAANKADLLPTAQQQQQQQQQQHNSTTSTNHITTNNHTTTTTQPPASNSTNPTIQAAAQHYAHSIHAAYFQTNAMTGEGIEPLFTHIARRLLQTAQAKERDGRREERSRQTVLMEQYNDQAGQGGCC